MLIYCAREGPERLGKPTGKLIPTTHIARAMAMEARWRRQMPEWAASTTIRSNDVDMGNSRYMAG